MPLHDTYNLSTWVFFFIHLHTVTAHYIFAHLLVNDTLTGEFQYVRNVTGDGTTADLGFQMAFPQYAKEINTNNFTCGRGAFFSAPTTESARVIAGSEVGFRIADIPYITQNAPDIWKHKIFHDGPANIYMTKALTNNLSTFAGNEADWFKIAEIYQQNATTWMIGPYEEHRWKSDVNFTIPSMTPPGAYLLRIEHFPFSPNLQFYVSCAHIHVVGPGGGIPKNFARFPGTYNYTGISNDFWSNTGIKGFRGIGPPLWMG